MAGFRNGGIRSRVAKQCDRSERANTGNCLVQRGTVACTFNRNIRKLIAKCLPDNFLQRLRPGVYCLKATFFTEFDLCVNDI